jgi:hypothetical protein
MGMDESHDNATISSVRICLIVVILVSLVALFDAIEAPPAQSRSDQPRSLSGSENASLPPLDDIIKKMVERANRQDDAAAELQYESRLITTIQTLSGDNVTETDRSVYRRYPLEGQLYEELLERNERPLNEREQREERKKRQEFIRQAREVAGQDRKLIETNDERQVRLGWNLINRFEASVVGAQKIDEEECWKVSFTPRRRKQPEKTRLDKMFNHSRGTLYIAQEDYGLRRIDFQMQNSVRYLWGLATLRHAEGRLEFERVQADVWLPKRFDFDINLRIFFRSKRQRIIREWVERQVLAY